MQPHKTFGSANRQPGGSSPPARSSCLGDDRVTTAQKASETTGQSLRLWRGIMILFGSLHTRTYGACAPCIRPPSPPTMAVLWLQQVMSHDSTSVTSTPSAHERSHVCRWLIQSMADNGVRCTHGSHRRPHSEGAVKQTTAKSAGGGRERLGFGSSASRFADPLYDGPFYDGPATVIQVRQNLALPRAAHESIVWQHSHRPCGWHVRVPASGYVAKFTWAPPGRASGRWNSAPTS